MQSNNIRVMASIKRSVSSLGLLKTSRSASYTNFALTVVYAGSTVYWSQNNNFMVDTYVIISTKPLMHSKQSKIPSLAHAN